jgi:hypothetical protein
MSFIPDSSQPEQGKSPMSDVCKNGDTDIGFNCLKLNDKGKDAHVFSYIIVC